MAGRGRWGLRWHNAGWYRRRGVDADGVPVWSLRLELPLVASLLTANVWYMALSGFGLVPGLPPRNSYALTSASLLAAAGVFMLALFVMGLRASAMVRKMPTGESLGANLGLDEAHVRVALAARGVKPVAAIGGHDYYDPADLKDAAVLLRPAAAPDGDGLLRSAGAGREEAAEQLLRPTDGGGE